MKLDTIHAINNSKRSIKYPKDSTFYKSILCQTFIFLPLFSKIWICIKMHSLFITEILLPQFSPRREKKRAQMYKITFSRFATSCYLDMHRGLVIFVIYVLFWDVLIPTATVTSFAEYIGPCSKRIKLLQRQCALHNPVYRSWRAGANTRAVGICWK